MAETDSQRGLSNHKAHDEFGKLQGITHGSTQVSAQPGCTRSCGFTSCREAGNWANLCQPGLGARRIAPGPQTISAPPTVCHLHPCQQEGGKEGGGTPSMQCLALPCCAQHTGKGEARHTQPTGQPCLHLHALRAILARSCSLSWPECVGNGVGGQRETAGSRQADPTLAPLPGVSELSSQLSVPCCSWKVLVVLLEMQGLCTVPVSQDCSRQSRCKEGDIPVLDLVLVDLDQILLRLPQGQSLDYLNLQRERNRNCPCGCPEQPFPPSSARPAGKGGY